MPLLVLVAAIAMLSIHIAAYPQFSPVDEFHHFDYLNQLMHGDLVQQNELVGQDAMEQEACRGIWGGFQPPPCSGRPYDPATFQYDGYNTAAGHGPLYYAVSGVGAEGLQATGLLPDDNLLTAARLTSVLWLICGLLVFMLVLRSLDVGAVTGGAVSVLLFATPAVLEANGRVNNDAPAFLIGALALYLVVREVLRRPAPWYVLSALSLVAIAIKVTNIIVILTSAIAMVLIALMRRQSIRQATAPFIAFMAPAIAAQVGWLAWMHLDKLPAPARPVVQNTSFYPDSIGIGDVAAQTFNFFTPVASPPLPPDLGGAPMAVTFTTMLHVVLLMALGAHFFGMHRRTQGSVNVIEESPSNSMVGAALAPAIIIGSVVSAITLVLMTWILNGAFVPLPSRYALSLLPMWGVLVATAIDRLRWQRIAIVSVAAVNYVGLMGLLVRSLARQ